MTLIVRTARVSFGGPDRFDVTRKSGGEAGAPFAPSWKLLGPALEARKHADRMRRFGCHSLANAYERGSWEEYERKYLDEMRASYAANRAAWSALLARETIVIVCYCVDAEHCHRRLLRAVILPKLGAVDGGEVSETAKESMR